MLEISDPASLTKLNGMIDEATQAHQKIDDLKSFIKDVADRAQEELGVQKAEFNQWVKERHAGDIGKKLEKLQTLADDYDRLEAARRNAAR